MSSSNTGRTIDHINRGTLKLDQVKTVVLDEADKMLDMVLLTSREDPSEDPRGETDPALFGDHAKTDPRPNPEISAGAGVCENGPETLTVPHVEQYYLGVQEGIKLDVLCRLIDLHNLGFLVFCNRKRSVDEVVRKLGAEGILLRVSRRHDPASAGTCHGQVQEEYLGSSWPRRCSESINVQDISSFQLRPSLG